TGTHVAIPPLTGLQSKVAATVRADKGVDYIGSSVGGGNGFGGTTSNKRRLTIALKPKAERGESVTQVIQRLRASANTVPGISVIFTPLQNIPKLDGRISQAEFQYTLQSSDTEALY